MRKVLVGMPGYVGLTGQAAAGFYRCTPDPHLATLWMQTGSLLAHNHNLLWCGALNGWKDGKYTHFAVQHSDVEPEAGWLDLMLSEMDAGGFDVLGAVVPLKDMRGLTSTAVGRTDGNDWRVSRRLTLSEVYDLPETFTGDDVGGPLLLNTGLMVVKLGVWSPRCWFTIRDGIACDVSGKFTAVVEPEDWFFSRRLHECGVRVGCTRKVKLAHRGPLPFPNTHAWGGQLTDADNLEANRAEEMNALPDCQGLPVA